MFQLLFQKLRQIFKKGLPERIVFLQIFVLFIIIYFFISFGVYFAEKRVKESNIKTIGDAFWFTIVTLPTIGYGDRYPVTAAGRLVTGIGIFGGLGLMATVLSTLPQLAIERAEKREKGLGFVNFTGHAIICNWHTEEGPTLVKEIFAGKTPIQKIVVISAGKRPIKNSGSIRWLCGEPSAEETLKRGGIKDAAAVICFPTHHENLKEGESADALSLMLAVTVGELAPNAWRGVFLQREENRKHFEMVGVNSIINLYRIGSMVMVDSLEDPGVETLINELLAYDTGNSLFKITIPQRVVGKNFGDLYRVPTWIPIALKRGNTVMANPDKKTVLQNNDEIIIITNKRPKLA